MADKKKEIANPFVEEITYADLLKEIGEASVKDYYKEVLSEVEISTLESELKYYKQNLKKAKEIKEEKQTTKPKE